MAFRIEEVVTNSFIRYVFGQENLVFDRKLSGKSQEILKLTFRGNPVLQFLTNFKSFLWLCHVQFSKMCLRSQDRHHSSQRIDFSALAPYISASAQDSKILNTIYIP